MGEKLPSSIAGLLMRISSEIQCPICLCVFTNPMQTPCQHVFCADCIARALRVSGADGERKAPQSCQCPVCKAKVSSKRYLREAVGMQALVNSFNALCESYLVEYGRPYDCPDDTSSVHTSDCAKKRQPVPQESNLFKLIMEREVFLDQLAEDHKTGCCELSSVPIPSSPDPFLFQSIPIHRVADDEGESEDKKEDKKQKETKAKESMPLGKKFTTSFIKRDQHEKIATFADKLQLQYCDCVTEDCFVVMPETGMIVKRSFKYMLAVLLGVPVLSSRYVDDCLSASCLLDHTAYIVLGDECESDGIVMRSLHSHNLSEPGLFAGLKFYLYGDFDRPGRNELESLIDTGQGFLAKDVNKLPKGTIILCDPSVTGVFEKDAGVLAKFRPIISIVWLMDCISCYALLDQHPYIVL